jgi:hypothetical protein
MPVVLVIIAESEEHPKYSSCDKGKNGSESCDNNRDVPERFECPKVISTPSAGNSCNNFICLRLGEAYIYYYSGIRRTGRGRRAPQRVRTTYSPVLLCIALLISRVALISMLCLKGELPFELSGMLSLVLGYPKEDLTHSYQIGSAD